MKNIKYILLLICIVLIFATCKKYPQGGFLSQGPKVLITDKQGAWQLKLYEVNGIDSTSLIVVSSNIPDYYTNFLNVYCEKSKGNLYTSMVNKFRTYNFTFSEDKKFLNIDKRFPSKDVISTCFNNNSGNNVCQRDLLCPENNLTLWKIIKLKDKECILTTEYNNNYKIILTR